MPKAVFFGHRNFNYGPYADRIRAAVRELIVKDGVGEFLCGYRGNFDRMCAGAVAEMKAEFPNIKNVMFLSYMPKEDFVLPGCFDESVYLAEKPIPPRYAIARTNELAAGLADIVVAGVVRDFGGAYTACRFAEKRGKKVVYVMSGTDIFSLVSK